MYERMLKDVRDAFLLLFVLVIVLGITVVGLIVALVVK